MKGLSAGAPNEKGTLLLCSRCKSILGRAWPDVVHVTLEGRRHAWTTPSGEPLSGESDADCPVCGAGTIDLGFVGKAAREGRKEVLVRHRRVYGAP